MSAVCVLTPMLIGAWPAIATAISGAASSLGFAIATSSRERPSQAQSQNSVQSELANSDIVSQRAGDAETMVIRQGDVTIEFRRNERGACSLCVTGDRSKAELKKIGEEVSGRVVQQFAYHKLVTELKKHNYSVVDENVQADSSIRVRVRMNG